MLGPINLVVDTLTFTDQLANRSEKASLTSQLAANLYEIKVVFGKVEVFYTGLADVVIDLANIYCV